jgi:hypothetical protein
MRTLTNRGHAGVPACGHAGKRACQPQVDTLKGLAMAVFGYCRVSTVRQVDEGESLDVQQRQLQGYAHSGLRR